MRSNKMLRSNSPRRSPGPSEKPTYRDMPFSVRLVGSIGDAFMVLGVLTTVLGFLFAIKEGADHF